jgi:hypothetical protein
MLPPHHHHPTHTYTHTPRTRTRTHTPRPIAKCALRIVVAPPPPPLPGRLLITLRGRADQSITSTGPSMYLRFVRKAGGEGALSAAFSSMPGPGPSPYPSPQPAPCAPHYTGQFCADCVSGCVEKRLVWAGVGWGGLELAGEGWGGKARVPAASPPVAHKRHLPPARPRREEVPPGAVSRLVPSLLAVRPSLHPLAAGFV